MAWWTLSKHLENLVVEHVRVRLREHLGIQLSGHGVKSSNDLDAYRVAKLAVHNGLCTCSLCTELIHIVVWPCLNDQ